jgi:hypothetical protein
MLVRHRFTTTFLGLSSKRPGGSCALRFLQRGLIHRPPHDGDPISSPGPLRPNRTSVRAVVMNGCVDDFDFNGSSVISAFDRETHRFANASLFDFISQVRKTADRSAVDVDDDIPNRPARTVDTPQSSTLRRRSWRSLKHHHSFDAQTRSDRLACSHNANTRGWYAALFDQLGNNTINGVCGNRKADTRIRS